MVQVTNGRVLGDTVDETTPPSLEFIIEQLKGAKTYFREFHSQCETEDEYYFLERPVPVPLDATEKEKVNPTRPATAPAIINVATDHVDVNNISIDVPLMPRSFARAERLKKFYYGTWASIKRPIKRTAVKHAFLYGIGWMKAVFTPHLYPKAPTQGDYGRLRDGVFVFDDEGKYKKDLADFMENRKLVFPISAENVNPQQLVWDDSRTGPKWVMRFVSSTVHDINRMFPEWKSSKQGSDTMEWVEYWDDTYYAYLADNEFLPIKGVEGPMRPQRHGYHSLPWEPVIPANTVDWDAGRPERRYQGILRSVHQLLDSEARLITQVEAMLHTVAYRTLDISGGTASERDQVVETYSLWGGLNNIANTHIDVSPMLTIPPDLFGHLERVQTMIEMATFPNVVRGIRPSGVSSGFPIAILAGQARLVFQGVADGMARAIEGMNSKFALFIEHTLRQSVTVHVRTEIHNFDQTIGPSDINGYTENVVILKAEAPEERERESVLAERLFRAGGISKYEFMRRIGIRNPLEEQNQIAAEELVAGLRDSQLDELKERLGLNLADQLGQVAPPGQGQVPAPSLTDLGNQFMPGQAQLQRPGETNLQQARVASRAGEPSVFPQSLQDLGVLGRQIGTPNGGAVPVPSGQTVGA